MNNYIPQKKAWLTLFSLFLSATVLVGRHMHITDAYDGLLTENYFTPFQPADILIFLLTAGFLWICLAFLHAAAIKAEQLPLCKAAAPFIHTLVWSVPVLFLLWLPYLLKYWPGFVFEDTMNSLEQAVGAIPLNNRNPLLYTLFIRFCVFCTGGLQSHNLTAACAMYTICQMLYAAVCLSYMIHVVSARFHPVWRIVCIALYGLSPYIAALNIAMWKDPVFSASVVALSVLLYRYAAADRSAAHSKKWLLHFIALSLVILFWRNNGFCALLGLLVFSAVALLRIRKNRESVRKPRMLTALCSALLLLWALIVVPGYRLIGVGTPKEEIAGIMLNQLARVASYDGRLSEEEAEYLDSILPLELYPSVYRPCCVDQFKWDSHFNYDALSGSRFLKTWLSVGMKNPLLYLEAWAMESYGFWTVNRPEINGNTMNISYGGTPYNLKGPTVEFDNYIIRFRSFLPAETDLFPYDSWSVPLGILNWGLLFTLLSLSVRRKQQYLIALAPQIGISAGLILQTPIFYLPRYGAAAQLLIPLYLLLLFFPDSGKDST